VLIVAALKTSMREIQKELQDKSRALTRKSKECDEAKQETEVRLSVVDTKYCDELASSVHRANEAEKAIKDIEETSTTDHSRMTSLLDTLKEKSEIQFNELENSTRMERDNSKRLSAKIREQDAGEGSRFRGIMIAILVQCVLFHLEWCIRLLRSSSIISCNITIIAHDQYIY